MHTQRARHVRSLLSTLFAPALTLSLSLYPMFPYCALFCRPLHCGVVALRMLRQRRRLRRGSDSGKGKVKAIERRSHLVCFCHCICAGTNHKKHTRNIRNNQTDNKIRRRGNQKARHKKTKSLARIFFHV